MASFPEPPPATTGGPSNTTFSYVFIPAVMEEPLEERTLDATGGLENDALIAALKGGTELGPNVDITALTVPTKTSNFVAVSVYMNGNSEAESMPVNRRIMGLLTAAGLPPRDNIKGPVAVSRYFDNDDAWHRIDLRADECVSDADWVRASLALNRGRKTQGSSLSDILKQQGAQMGLGSNGPNGAPVIVDGRNGGAYGAEAAAAAAATTGAGASEGKIEGGEEDFIQTGDEIELTVPLPPGATKKDVRVKFLPDRLTLSFEGHDGAGLKGTLGGKIDLDGCTWTVGDGNVVITMEKKAEGNWPFALRKD